MTDDLAEWFVFPVAIERLGTAGAYGDTYAAPQTVNGWVDDTGRLVRDSEGQEVVSSTRVYLPIGTADIPAGSRITLPATFENRQAHVITTSRHDAGGLDLPAHLELALT